MVLVSDPVRVVGLLGQGVKLFAHTRRLVDVVGQQVQVEVTGEAVDQRHQYVGVVSALGNAATGGGPYQVDTEAGADLLVELLSGVQAQGVAVQLGAGEDALLVQHGSAEAVVALLTSAADGEVVNGGATGLVEVLDVVGVGL